MHRYIFIECIRYFWSYVEFWMSYACRMLHIVFLTLVEMFVSF